MTRLIPERLSWAMTRMTIDPSDRLLEIGCGHGDAVSLIGCRLASGTITAIDRSETMIGAASRKNAAFVSSGKANFIAASLHEVDWGQQRFNIIFAVNVNLFRMQAARELAMIRRLLLPDGALYLFNQPPAASKIAHIADATARNLADAGFQVRDVIVGDELSAPAVCVMADRGGPHEAG